MVVKFARPKSLVTGFRKTGLQGLYLGPMDKIIRGPVSPGGGSILSAESGSSTRRAEHPGRMGVGEQHAPFGKSIQVWRDRPWLRLHTPDPVIHVIHDQKQDVGTLATN